MDHPVDMELVDKDKVVTSLYPKREVLDYPVDTESVDKGKVVASLYPRREVPDHPVDMESVDNGKVVASLYPKRKVPDYPVDMELVQVSQILVGRSIVEGVRNILSVVIAWPPIPLWCRLHDCCYHHNHQKNTSNNFHR